MHDIEEPGGFRPHRQVNHATDAKKKVNVAKLVKWHWTLIAEQGSRVASFEDNDDRVVFRIPHKLTVEFFTRKNRWRVRGEKKTTHGTVEQFMQWFETKLREE